MTSSTATSSARPRSSPGVALFMKDIRLAGGIVAAALVVLASVTLLERMLPVLFPEAMRRLRLDGVSSAACTVAFLLMPALVAVALSFGDNRRRGELLTAMLPLTVGARWRSKLLVLAMAYALFAVLAGLSWSTHSAIALGVPESAPWLSAISALGVVWGFGAVGFTRDAGRASILAPLLPLLSIGVLLLAWMGLGAPCRTLLWSALGFDPTVSTSMTLRDDGGQLAIDRLAVLALRPLSNLLFVSLLIAGFWTAWRARGFIVGRQSASRSPGRGIAGLALLVALLGIASTAVATVAAQFRMGFDMLANRNLQTGYARAMAMPPEKIARASVEFSANLDCVDQLWGRPFAWSDRFVAKGGVLRADEVSWQSSTQFAEPDWHVRHGMMVAFRTRLLLPPDRNELLAAIERLATDDTGLNFTQRLDLAMLADEFTFDVPLVLIATRALAEQRDACEVLAAMEALAVRGGVMRGFSLATCECRVRAYERLRSIRGEVSQGTAGTRWAGRLEEESVDRALAVLREPMSFLRAPLDERLALETRSAGNVFAQRRQRLLECLDCDISTLIDAEGLRKE